MAKSGGVLNAICAKLLKGNLGPGQADPASDPAPSPSEKVHVLEHKNNENVDETDQRQSEQDEDVDKENNNNATKHNLTNSTVLETPAEEELQVAPSGSRRNRRKNVKPRNIQEFRDVHEEDYGKDELEAFEINNRDVDFEAIVMGHSAEEEKMDEDEDEQVLDLTGASQGERTKHVQSVSGNNGTDGSDSDSGVLDLSVSRSGEKTAVTQYFNDDDSCDENSKQGFQSIEGNQSDSNLDSSQDESSRSSPNFGMSSSQNLLQAINFTQTTSTRPGTKAPSAAPGEAVALKNYAQNTVSELLSMYGLGGEEAEAVTQSIPLQKFSTGHILMHQPGTLQRGLKRPAPTTSQSPLKVIPNKKPAESSSTSSSLSSSLSSLTTSQNVAAMSSVKTTAAATEPRSSGSATSLSYPKVPNEGMYAKFVDSVSKLAKMPQGALIGSPPVALPGSMSSMIHMAASASAMLHAKGAGGPPSPFLPPSTVSPNEGKASAVQKFATSAEYVKACFNPSLAPKLAAVAAATTGGKNLLPDYTRYIKRFASFESCGGNHCRDMSYKEHFHCLDCSFRVFVKKEEMIRHFKWHKKRDESLQHGFMRYSPMDDCSKKFGPCTHNSRQTHYHCLQPGCNKVYISTSDTQMHANYHRKDSAIIQEGFQRFRATEDCGTQQCAFYGQRTTHFHCRRTGCNFTFKNKADMEKHKAYHQKDEILGRDGFKKFMKYEHCHFTNCRYSKVSNHIHCIRPGCEYVLHSTGQLYSHKRRHERRDFENAYRRFKDEQKKKDGPTTANSNPPHSSPSPSTSKSITHTTTPQPRVDSAHSAISPAHRPHSYLQSSSAGSSHSPRQPSVKQEAEYIDLEDLSQFDNSGRSSPENSMTPTDLSMSGSSASSSKTDYRSDTDSAPPAHGGVAVKNEEVGLDLSSGSSQAKNNSSSNVHKPQASTLAKLASKLNSSSSLNGSLNLPVPSSHDAGEVLSPVGPALNASLGSGAAPGVAGFIPKSSPPVNHKPEKDESWKKYLTRYTANDPCHPRCQCLYKDHYHCNIEGCSMIFRNKDGVREHSRYHEQQDRITSLSFMTYDNNTDCVPGCEMNRKALHYHCLWSDCGTIVKMTDPPFARLEHHKIHEYSRASNSRQPRQMSLIRPEQLKRRRGRPPKYPKTEIPVVPKVEMSEKEIADELRRSTDGFQNTLMAGFKKFAAFHSCPDEKCIFISKEHYHCVRPRCHHATDRADVLNLHAKDFHSYINILDGFEFFDRTVNCRRPHCHNNKANKHFHCVRPRCDYSFVRYSTMAQHDKKHKLIEMGKDITQQPPKMALPSGLYGNNPGHMLLPHTVVTTNPSVHLQPPSGAQSDDKTVVKTAGTYFPMSSLGQGIRGQRTLVSPPGGMMNQRGQVSITITPPSIFHAATSTPVLLNTTSSGATKNSQSGVINIAPKPMPVTNASNVSEALPLSMLLQQKPHQNVPQLNWLELKMKMHYGMEQNCGRPFCKLKKKDHFHCYECNQAFSDPTRLKTHVIKHGLKVDSCDNLLSNHGVLPQGISPTPITIAPIPDDDNEELANFSDDDEEEEEEESGEDGLNPSSSLNLDASSFTRLIETGALSNSNSGVKVPQVNVIEPVHQQQPRGCDVLDLSKMSPHKSDPKESPLQEDVPIQNVGIEQPVNEKVKENAEQMEKAETEKSETSEPQSPVGSESSSSGEVVGRRSSRKRTATRHADFVDSDIAVGKQRKLSSPRPPPLVPTPKEDNCPDGYVKFKFSDDCEHERCPYRASSTHYHCLREDCKYSFSDKSRAAPHTQKHERLDSVTEEEFQLFQADAECNQSDCEHSQKNLHYHCLKCSFICTDSSKVLIHSKHHMKMGGKKE